MSEHRVWVLLRGLVKEKRHWGDFIETFQSCFPDDQIVLYDFPGNGLRCKEESETHIIDMVDDVRSHLSENSIEQPVHVIALSLGGMVAVEWMNKYPDECAAAILISTSLRGLNPFYQRLLPSAYVTAFHSLLFSRDARKTETASLKLVSNIIASDSVKRENTINDWVTYEEQCPVSGINGLRQLLAAIRFRVPEQRPEIPILVLSSLQDHLVSPECSISLAKHWDLPIQTHDLSGHDIPLDDGDWVCRKISQWLDE